MTQQIAAIWRDLDIENHVAWKKIADRRTDFRFGRQNQKSGCILAETKLDRTTKHSFGLNTAEFAFSNFSSVRQLRARKREGNFVTDFIICRTANDLTFRSARVIDFANGQAIGVRMTRRRDDLGNNHVVDLRTARLDPFCFDAGAGQQIRDLFRIAWKIDKFAQPVDGKFHANWRRKRKSFWAKSLRSG